MMALRRKLFLAAAAGLLLPLLSLSGLRWAGEEGPPLKGPFAGAFVLLERPLAPPPTEFLAVQGGSTEKRSLSDFAGKVVLLNLWATWCAPCVREMPSLAALERQLAPEGLAVVAVSLDRGGLAEVAAFYGRLGLEGFPIYLDPKSGLAAALKVSGLPTSFLLDREGRIVGKLEGAAPWDGPEARALIRYYLEGQPSSGLVPTGG